MCAFNATLEFEGFQETCGVMRGRHCSVPLELSPRHFATSRCLLGNRRYLKTVMCKKRPSGQVWVAAKYHHLGKEVFNFSSFDWIIINEREALQPEIQLPCDALEVLDLFMPVDANRDEVTKTQESVVWYALVAPESANNLFVVLA